MKRGLFLFIMVLCGLNLQAQKSEEPMKEYFLDAEFFFAQEEYLDALVDYMELYNNGYSEFASINYRIGICYLNISGQKDKAIPYLLEAVKNIKDNNKESKFNEEKAPKDAWLYLGNAYRINYRLNDAIEAYLHYEGMLPPKDLIAREYVTKEIAACKSAQAFMQSPVNVNKINLGSTINGSSSNYRGVLSGDGRSLLYMNELPFYNAVYYTKLINGQWKTPVNITPQIQSDGDQYVTSVSYDGLTLYLTRDDNFNSDIWISNLKDSVWGKSEPLQGEINSKYWESHASISKDGKTIYFTSNRNDGFGGMDIYKSVLGNDHLWKTPVNMGNVINTALNEDTPFITEDENTLYFSSQGHLGMGGYDFYKSELKTDGQWSEPVNLGYPLSTTDNDLFYYPWNNGNYALISSLEPDGFGKEDLYELQIVKPNVALISIEELVKNIYEVKEIVKTEEIKETEEPEIEQPADTSHFVLKEVEETPKQKQKVEEITKITETPKKIMILKPVYFEFNSIAISLESKKQLDEISILLKEYNNLSVDLIGYADAVGPADYNKSLSVKRALSALNYLLSKGVDARKINAKGLGETNFAAINTNPDGTDNPEGRKYNRRVEFEISGADKNKLEIKLFEVPENLRFK